MGIDARKVTGSPRTDLFHWVIRTLENGIPTYIPVYAMNAPNRSTGATAPAWTVSDCRKFLDILVNMASGSFRSSNIIISATAKVTANTRSIPSIFSSMYSLDISTLMNVLRESSPDIFSDTLYSLLLVRISAVSA